MDLNSQTDQDSVPAGDQPVDVYEPTTPMSSETPANEREFLEWKANGRPLCPRCRKSHFGACKSQPCNQPTNGWLPYLNGWLALIGQWLINGWL
jgi:hypothetical protein